MYILEYVSKYSDDLCLHCVFILKDYVLDCFSETNETKEKPKNVIFYCGNLKPE